MPTSLCETLDAVNPVLYPSIDTILCVMLTMPVTSATAERSFSVQNFRSDDFNLTQGRS
jgi:hypothetical protein